MNKLPLYHRPSAMVFLDDEASYLEMLAIVMPKDWSISLHTRIRDYMAQVHAQAKLWEEDIALHRDMIHTWHTGPSLPELMLNYWRSQPQRYSLPSIAVVDYAMPAANGLEVLKMSPAWPPFRVLLTGKADEHIAVQAFNDGLIDKYIPKQQPNLVEVLVRELHRHYQAPMDFHDGIWSNAMSRGQLACLQNAQVQQELRTWLQTHAYVEYVVLPEPFGLLALDAQGFAHWLQFERPKDLASAVELAKAAGLDKRAQTLIEQGSMLSSAEWQQAIRDSSPVQMAQAHTWGAGEGLIMAHFPQTQLGAVSLSHQEFIKLQAKRSVSN